MAKARKGEVVNKSPDGDKLNEFQTAKKGKKAKKKLDMVKSPCKFLAAETWKCKECKQEYSEGEVDSDGKPVGWVECDQCSGKFHRTCAGINVKQFDFLYNSPEDNFQWFCNQCLQAKKDGKDVAATLAQHSAKLDALNNMFVQMQEENTKNMENQFKKMMDMMKGTSGTGAEEQIKIHVEEIIIDQNEKKEKEKNLILYGLEEGKEKDDTINKEEDLKKTKDLFKYVNPEVSLKDLKASNITRIGYKKSSEDNPKPRPVKVELDSVDSKWQLIKNAKKLKDEEKYKNIGISFDKTRREQAEYRRLKEEKDRKNKDTESGSDFVIFRNKVVLRTDIKNIRRQDKEKAGTGWASEAPIGGNLGGAGPNSSVGAKGAPDGAQC